MMISRCLALMIEPAVLTKATPASSSGSVMLDPGLEIDVLVAAAGRLGAAAGASLRPEPTDPPCRFAMLFTLATSAAVTLNYLRASTTSRFLASGLFSM